MKALIFGASGGTGRLVVETALAQNHLVTAFVRDPSKLSLSHPHLRIEQGDVGDAARVEAVVAGHDGVVSTLGVGKPLNSDPVVVTGIRNVVASMERHGVRRLVYLSFIGVSESRASAGFILRYVARFPLRHEIADHELKERVIRASQLDWTIVRPPKLTSGAALGTHRIGEDIVAGSLLPTLSRADVAAFMVRQLSDPTYTRKAPRLLP
jgi:putative NADH-flavin reductase